MRQRRRLALLLLLSTSLSGFAACNDGSSGGGTVEGTRPPPGGPLAGLTADEQAAFERGKLLFEKRFTPDEGLGPLYNATSCESCHSTPTTGGSSQLYRNFYLAMWFDGANQVPLPGLPSAVVPSYGKGTDFTLVGERKKIPELVGPIPPVVAQRNGLSIFGVGLFEFVTDATILSNADPEDADGDGISGRFNTDGGFTGRLGVKAQSNNIEFFTRPPLRNQMGITSDPFLGSAGAVSLGHMLLPQVSGGHDDPFVDADDVPDPEISHDDLGDLIAFTRFLAPPEPVSPFSAAATRGEARFDQIGCTKCHIPELPTSRFGPARAFTDLLIHELGDDLADGLNFGRPQFSSLSLPNASREFRTAPLWGVSLSGPFLHDGRAETLREAVELHGGEAEAIRDAFLALTAPEQADLIEFLEHL